MTAEETINQCTNIWGVGVTIGKSFREGDLHVTTLVLLMPISPILYAVKSFPLLALNLTEIPSTPHLTWTLNKNRLVFKSYIQCNWLVIAHSHCTDTDHLPLRTCERVGCTDTKHFFHLILLFKKVVFSRQPYRNRLFLQFWQMTTSLNKIRTMAAKTDLLIGSLRALLTNKRACYKVLAFSTLPY